MSPILEEGPFVTDTQHNSVPLEMSQREAWNRCMQKNMRVLSSHARRHVEQQVRYNRQVIDGLAVGR